MSAKTEEMAKEDPTMGRIGKRPYWVLWLSIFIRAVHLAGGGVVLTAFLFPESLSFTLPYTAIAGVSGGALFYAEWLRHREIFREFAGVATIVKSVLLGLAIHGFLPVRETLLAVFFLAAVAAHAPRMVRHKLLF